MSILSNSNGRGVRAVSCLMAVALSAGLTGCARDSSAAASADSAQADQGAPVSVRTIQEEDFSVYLKFATVVRAKAESTAYASLSDVVREIPARVGDKVSRDQVIVVFSRDNQQFQQARLSYEGARSVYERSEALFSQAGISRQDFENVRTQYEIAKSAYRQISDTIEVKAPIDGYLTRLYVGPTGNVKPGDPLFTVSNQDGYEAKFYVTIEEIDLIKLGARASLRSGSVASEGRVTEISLSMDASRKAFPVTAFFKGESSTLVSGMSADIAVETYRNPGAVVARRNELSRSGQAWSAYVADGGAAKRRDLVIGKESGFDLEIVGGLRPGEELIVSGLQGIAEDTPVRVVKTVASR